MFGNRGLRRLSRAMLRPGPYRAALNLLLQMRQPAKWMTRYVTARGTYPTTADITLNGGHVEVVMWSHHDLLTVNEVFFRRDYQVRGDENTIVDFGSNVGLSAAYFLAAAPGSHVYLFEPVPANVERLKLQLAGKEQRFTLIEAAVGLDEGEISFGVEDSGRYCGIGRGNREIVVPCVKVSKELASIIAARGRIDLLKIDVEGLEKLILGSLSPELTRNIGVIYAETMMSGYNPLAATHTFKQVALNMARFEPRTRPWDRAEN